MPPQPARPGLGGRNDKKRPGQFDEADAGRPPGDSGPPGPGRFGAPPSLLGIRDPEANRSRSAIEADAQALQRVRMLAGRLAPAAELAEDGVDSALQAQRSGLAGRGAPGAAEPVDPETAAAARPSSTPPPSSAPREGRDRREQASDRAGTEDARRADFVGDSELFTAEEAAPAVIDRPDEPPPVTQPGASLGRAPGEPGPT